MVRGQIVQMSLWHLPTELSSYILVQLPPSDVTAYIHTCRSAYNLCYDDAIWRTLVYAHMGTPKRHIICWRQLYQDLQCRVITYSLVSETTQKEDFKGIYTRPSDIARSIVDRANHQGEMFTMPCIDGMGGSLSIFLFHTRDMSNRQRYYAMAQSIIMRYIEGCTAGLKGVPSAVSITVHTVTAWELPRYYRVGIQIRTVASSTMDLT